MVLIEIIVFGIKDLLDLGLLVDQELILLLDSLLQSGVQQKAGKQK